MLKTTTRERAVFKQDKVSNDWKRLRATIEGRVEDFMAAIRPSAPRDYGEWVQLGLAMTEAVASIIEASEKAERAETTVVQAEQADTVIEAPNDV